LSSNFLNYCLNLVFKEKWTVKAEDLIDDVQGLILKECPSKLLLTTIQCVFSTLQTFVVAIAFERDFAKWKIGFDVRLLSVVYCVSINVGKIKLMQMKSLFCVFRKIFC
jgi:hypothetical protein